MPRGRAVGRWWWRPGRRRAVSARLRGQHLFPPPSHSAALTISLVVHSVLQARRREFCILVRPARSADAAF